MTTENNKIIAEFMDYAPEDVQEIEGFWNSPNKFPNHDYFNIMFGAMKFHSDWNWLMEAVSKVFEKEEFIKDDLIFKLNDALLECNKDSLYLAVLNCVKWYNEQNK